MFRMDNLSITLFFTYLIIMAGVTYLIRAVPFVLVRKKIENKYIRAFLNYIPYAVLTAMTIPAIFFSTSPSGSGMFDTVGLITASAGFLAAVILSYMEKSLITVALAASVTVMVTQFVIGLF